MSHQKRINFQLKGSKYLICNLSIKNIISNTWNTNIILPYCLNCIMFGFICCPKYFVKFLKHKHLLGFQIEITGYKHFIKNYGKWSL